MTQRRPAYAGHERLDEVQHVEVLRAEEDIDVGDQIRRRRDELDLTAIGHPIRGPREEEARERLIGREHRVALAREHRLHALSSFLDLCHIRTGRDDGDAMAALGESLDEIPHLTIDARGSRPDERRQNTYVAAHAAHATSTAEEA